MLLTGTETLHLAAKQGWALAAFAVYNLEMVQAIVAAAEEADRPVLLLAGSSHFPSCRADSADEHGADGSALNVSTDRRASRSLPGPAGNAALPRRRLLVGDD